jgi:hypothetical protein
MRLAFLSVFLLAMAGIASAYRGPGTPVPGAVYLPVDSMELTRVNPYYGRIPENQTILLQNQPNPALDFTDIYFFLYRTGPVTLKLYDSRGREIGYFYIARNGIGSGGTWYHIRFFVKTISPGRYYYRLWTPDYNAVKKMIVVK